MHRFGKRLLQNFVQKGSRPIRIHPGLVIVPNLLSTAQQRILLSHCLNLLDSPSRTTSFFRKKNRAFLKTAEGKDHQPCDFKPERVYEFESGHFDRVIQGYREMLVRPGAFPTTTNGSELEEALQTIYQLLPSPPPPPPTTTTTTTTASTQASASTTPSSFSNNMVNSENRSKVDPPDHLIMHLLHLSSQGEIRPHVDHLEAFGSTIVGISLGSERIMKFSKVTSSCSKATERPSPIELSSSATQAVKDAEMDESCCVDLTGKEQGSQEVEDQFQVLLQPGEAYIQT